MPEKQIPLTPEQQKSVEGALKALKNDIGDPKAMEGLNTLQELRSLLAALQIEKDTQSLLTKEKRDTLRAAIQQKKTDLFTLNPDTFREGTDVVDELSQGVDRDLDSLEGHLVAAENAAQQPAATTGLEAAPDRTSKFVKVMEVAGKTLEKGLGKVNAGVKVTKEAFMKSWDKTKGGVMAMGELFGVTFPEKAGEAWNFIVKNFWKIMATPTSFGMKENFFTKIARENVDKADIWEGIRKFKEQNTQAEVLVTAEDCNKAYRDLAPLLTGFPGKDMYERVSRYLQKYMLLNPGTATSRTTITMQKLLAANLSNGFSVQSGAPEGQQNLFTGIPNLPLRLNQRLGLNGPTPEFSLNDGRGTMVILDKSTITVNKNKFSVKNGSTLINASLEPRSANATDLFVYWDGTTPLQLSYLVTELTRVPPNLYIQPFTFEKNF
ncbi:MAG: hypothetical protein Greene101449_952 [Candidatus Peregrinibacteria bacterium Greene1014_49]|nr:MAG: hypothetical protein Greene101449_952 [Candidatus Peregrinibacteria bacterium Greene1014_49]